MFCIAILSILRFTLTLLTHTIHIFRQFPIIDDVDQSYVRSQFLTIPPTANFYSAFSNTPGNNRWKAPKTRIGVLFAIAKFDRKTHLLKVQFPDFGVFNFQMKSILTKLQLYFPRPTESYYKLSHPKTPYPKEHTQFV